MVDIMGISRGVSRLVLAIGGIVVKLPSFHNGMRYFVMGMLGNVLEGEHWHMHHHPNLAPVYHCGPLGLWLVMKRYRTLAKRRLTKQELDTLPFINIDNNGSNVAIEDGRLVLIDYGNPGMYYMASAALHIEGRPE